MKITSNIAALILGIQCCTAVAEDSAKPEWRSLFNGKDLGGWVQDGVQADGRYIPSLSSEFPADTRPPFYMPPPNPVAKSVWTVDQGVLRCSAPPELERHKGLLALQKTRLPEDFILTVEWRTPLARNKGARPRQRTSLTHPDNVDLHHATLKNTDTTATPHPYLSCLSLDFPAGGNVVSLIPPTHGVAEDLGFRSGSFGIAPPKYAKAGDWNESVIVCAGPKVTYYINRTEVFSMNLIEWATESDQRTAALGKKPTGQARSTTDAWLKAREQGMYLRFKYCGQESSFRNIQYLPVHHGKIPENLFPEKK